MFQFVKCRSLYAIAASLFITLIIDKTYCSNPTHRRKGGIDVFDLLLGLYKLNPLKASKVYTKFANNVLTHNDKRSFNVKQLFSSENGNKVTMQQLTDIERVLHPLYKNRKHSMEQPEFDIENIDPENFNVDVIIQDNFQNYKDIDKPSTKTVLDGIDISGFENILPNDEENTKLIPAHQWLLPTTVKRIPAPESEWFPKNEEYSNGEQLSQVPNTIQEPTIITNNELTPADVVVF